MDASDAAAGAVEQLKTHCGRLKVPLYERGYEKDPAKDPAKVQRADQLVVFMGDRFVGNGGPMHGVVWKAKEFLAFGTSKGHLLLLHGMCLAWWFPRNVQDKREAAPSEQAKMVSALRKHCQCELSFSYLLLCNLDHDYLDHKHLAQAVTQQQMQGTCMDSINIRLFGPLKCEACKRLRYWDTKNIPLSLHSPMLGRTEVASCSYLKRQMQKRISKDEALKWTSQVLWTAGRAMPYHSFQYLIHFVRSNVQCFHAPFIYIPCPFDPWLALAFFCRSLKEGRRAVQIICRFI
eukprot:scaffold6281_cov22-Tisochrysis_lutea.AAC.1